MISLIAALMLQAGLTQSRSSIELPGWLAGAWVSGGRTDDWTEEWWTAARGGIMLGSSRSGRRDAVGFFEHMRIERTTTGLQFCALPKGAPGACFPAIAAGAREIVFENSANDYPTRIVYRLEEGGISAEISGPGGTRRQSWRFVPLAD